MIYAAIFALILMPSTIIVQLPDKVIVRRDNFVIAATVDGFLCDGTKVPLSVNCHRAVLTPTVSGRSQYVHGVAYHLPGSERLWRLLRVVRSRNL